MRDDDVFTAMDHENEEYDELMMNMNEMPINVKILLTHINVMPCDNDAL